MESSNSFSVGENKYVVSRMNTLTANRVARKFGTVLVFLGTLTPTEGQHLTADKYARAIVATASQVPDLDMDDVLRSCLGVVKRISGGQPAPLLDANGGLMFQDIDVMELNTILYEVLNWHKLIDFFAAARSES